MIAVEPTACHTATLPGWQQELAQAVRDPLELLRLLDLTPEQFGAGSTPELLRQAAADFALRVPRGFIARMKRGDPHDPLLRQVLPLGPELLPVPGYVNDPLHELDVREAPGLLHKYIGRALMIVTGACAVHCRYCFRRHYDYSADQSDDDRGRWASALARIKADHSIKEIILSGGDPLSLGNSRLAQLLQQLLTISHVERIRIHTRTPVVLPTRVDDGLLDALAPARQRLVMVVHANHPAEIDVDTTAALHRLGETCVALLNQSVLLAGVNDNAATLAELSQQLFKAATLPYYLHQLDPVAGAAHFAVSDNRALQIYTELIATLPGYLVPKLVREVAGANGKTPIVNGDPGNS